ncbi:SDR family NAD(P)-dependent oxidoreductase, partial [Nocardia wallacei]|uniref:SDR family NAD(P)-dependent oxidoreductase n=1 Tax=Nocardia wallacei TaxID=480035 RepID=UPI0024537917
MTVALVTSGSRGIGRAISRRLAADGADVVVNYRENAAAAAEVVTEVTAAGGRAVAAPGGAGPPGPQGRLLGPPADRVGGREGVVAHGR